MKTLLTDIHKNCCSENKRDGLHSSLSFLLLTSSLLHFRGTRFGHLHGVLAVGVKHRLLQRPWSALGVGGGVARSPGAELVLAVALRRRQAGGVFVLEAKTLCVCVWERDSLMSFFQLHGILQWILSVRSLHVASLRPSPQSPLSGTHFP